jgi:hypothetical protein
MVPGPNNVPPGVTTTFHIRADAPVASIVLSVEGASGFFQLDLAAPTTSRLFDLGITAAPPRDPFFVVTRVIAPDGTVGPPASTRFRLLD